MKIACPGCETVLKATSPEGFAPDAKVKCPKCKEKFLAADAGRVASQKPRPVETEPDADEEDDDLDDAPKPKKKKKKIKGKKSEGGSYKSSPARFIILAVLLLVMGVLAYMLFLKKSAEGG